MGVSGVEVDVGKGLEHEREAEEGYCGIVEMALDEGG